MTISPRLALRREKRKKKTGSIEKGGCARKRSTRVPNGFMNLWIPGTRPILPTLSPSPRFPFARCTPCVHTHTRSCLCTQFTATTVCPINLRYIYINCSIRRFRPRINCGWNCGEGNRSGITRRTRASFTLERWVLRGGDGSGVKEILWYSIISVCRRDQEEGGADGEVAGGHHAHEKDETIV